MNANSDRGTSPGTVRAEGVLGLSVAGLLLCPVAYTLQLWSPLPAIRYSIWATVLGLTRLCTIRIAKALSFNESQVRVEWLFGGSSLYRVEEICAFDVSQDRMDMLQVTFCTQDSKRLVVLSVWAARGTSEAIEKWRLDCEGQMGRSVRKTVPLSHYAFYLALLLIVASSTAMLCMLV